MTYCIGVQVDEGQVFLSDSRTNAGVDHISTFRKMMFFEIPGERALVLLSAGNLAVSQSITGLLRERVNSAKSSLVSVRTLPDAARLVGDAVRDVYSRDAEALKQHGIEFNPTFIIGGQIGGQPPRLFHVYSAGNFIETTADTRYFQIGESKYGKPIIDRVVKADTPLAAAAKCALISMDSTIRSNLSVGMPLDLAIIRRDALQISLHRSIGPDDAYFKVIREGWGESLRTAFHALPDPPIP
ncbi:MAG TPA: proteasome-type protease [Steroidobacteraceae bacterium]|nr:proteasome-type protease [Steroidobacteraceae bacterium]